MAGSPHDVQRTEVDGIPAFWAHGPPPFTGSLIFRVGRSDETLPTNGITHVVEHLAVYAAGPTLFQAGGMVDQTRTMFFASGTERDVVGFLGDVARALGDLPLNRLELERQVLLTEAASWSSGPWGTLMAMRFGAQGHGLLGYDELGLRRVTADDVRDWAGRYFTSGNSAIWMTGPLPEDLRLDLPAGERRPPCDLEPLPELDLPAYAQEAQQGVTMSMIGTRSTPLTTAAAIAADAAHSELRLEGGVTYSIVGGYDPFTADLAYVALGADCLETHAQAVQDGLVGLLHRLADNGPTAEELERNVGSIKQRLADPLTVAGHLDADATNELFGARIYTTAELVAELDALSRADVAQAVSELLPTALLLTPQQVNPPPSGFRPYGEWKDEPLAGRHHKAKAARPWKKLGEIVAAPEGISYLPTDGEVVTIRFDECAAFLRWPDVRATVIDVDGSWIEIREDSIRDVEALLAHLEDHIPAERVVEMET